MKNIFLVILCQYLSLEVTHTRPAINVIFLHFKTPLELVQQDLASELRKNSLLFIKTPRIHASEALSIQSKISLSSMIIRFFLYSSFLTKKINFFLF